MTVEVFVGRTPDSPQPDDLAVLDDAERARAERFVTDELAAHYAGAHAGVRRILATRLGVAPRDIRFGRTRCPKCASDEHGAPCVEWPPGAPYVSLSHTGALWMLACSHDHVVGADIEVRRRMDVEGVGRHVLSPHERELLAAAAPDDRLSLLLTCWVRKEAVLKAVGVGIAVALADVEVRPLTPGPVRVDVDLSFGASRWWVHDVHTGPDTYAAVAVAAGPQARVPPYVTLTDPTADG